MPKRNVYDLTKPETFHRFIDEAGDMTFFGKGGVPIIGTDAVSKSFMIGMVKFKHPLVDVRKMIKDFAYEISNDPFFNTMPSVQKRIQTGDFYFHAKDDPPELRYKFFEFLKNDLDFTLQVVVGRKDLGRFVNKHNKQEKEFYIDLLSRLIFDKGGYEKLILNVATLGNTVRTQMLEEAVIKAERLAVEKKGVKGFKAQIKFNIQPYQGEPLLTVPDYGLWAVQRVFERGENRFYDLIKPKIRYVTDLYGSSSNGREPSYSPAHPLTKGNLIT